MITTVKQTSRDAEEVRVNMKNLNLTLESYIWRLGTDPFFWFPNQFCERGWHAQDVWDADLIALPKFLTEQAETQFRTNISGASRYGGINCWPEAIQYLLRIYVTSSAMRKFLEDLRNIRQCAAEVEEE